MDARAEHPPESERSIAERKAMSYWPPSLRSQIRLSCWYCATGPTYQTRSWETPYSEWQGAISPKLAGESHY